MKNHHLIIARAKHFAATNGIEVREWSTYNLLKYAALDIVPFWHSNILFEAMESVSLTDVEFSLLIDIISLQIDTYAPKITAECIKYCLDYVENALLNRGVIELVQEENALQTHYAYNFDTRRFFTAC